MQNHPAHASTALLADPGPMEGESADDLLIDEIAEALRGRGCPAAAALQYASTALEMIRARGASGEPAGAETPAETRSRIEGLIREMLRGIIDARNSKYEARIHLIARGDDENDESMRAVARDYLQSPEAISKRVAAHRITFALPETQFNKSEAACRKYARTNHRRIVPPYPPIPAHG